MASRNETAAHTLAVVLALEAGEHHLCAWDELGGVQQVLEQGVVVPGDACSALCQTRPQK